MVNRYLNIKWRTPALFDYYSPYYWIYFTLVNCGKYRNLKIMKSSITLKWWEIIKCLHSIRKTRETSIQVRAKAVVIEGQALLAPFNLNVWRKARRMQNAFYFQKHWQVSSLLSKRRITAVHKISNQPRKNKHKAPFHANQSLWCRCLWFLSRPLYLLFIVNVHSDKCSCIQQRVCT